MDSGKRKALVVKIKAVARTLKEYKSYKTEVESYDQTLVAQNKRQAEFYKESTEALESVKKSLINFVQNLEVFLIENESEIEEEHDQAFVTELEQGKQNIEDIRVLFPAEL